MSKHTTRAERLARSGIAPLFDREYRALVPSKPRGPEAARSLVEVRAEVRADEDDDGPVIEGTGTVYDVWYQVGRIFPFREKFATGAFAKTLADGADVRSMKNHSPAWLLGRSKSGSLEVWETDDALNYRIHVNADDPNAMSTHAQVARGDIDGSSIWFSVVRETWTFADDDNDLEMDEVVINEAKLYELGPVVFPANEATEANARSLDSVLRDLGVDDEDRRRDAVMAALADPDKALDALRTALDVDELPDLRAVCTAAGQRSECSCSEGRDGRLLGPEHSDGRGRADEESPDPGTPPTRHLLTDEDKDEIRSKALAHAKRIHNTKDT